MRNVACNISLICERIQHAKVDFCDVVVVAAVVAAVVGLLVCLLYK